MNRGIGEVMKAFEVHKNIVIDREGWIRVVFLPRLNRSKDKKKKKNKKFF